MIDWISLLLKSTKVLNEAALMGSLTSTQKNIAHFTAYFTALLAVLQNSKTLNPIIFLTVWFKKHKYYFDIDKKHLSVPNRHHALVQRCIKFKIKLIKPQKRRFLVSKALMFCWFFSGVFPPLFTFTSIPAGTPWHLWVLIVRLW